jgi:hypothetical protein
MGSEFAQPLTPLRISYDACDLRASIRGEFHSKTTHAARGTGNQHAFPQEEVSKAERAQCSATCYGQRSSSSEAYMIRKHSKTCRENCCLLAPSALVHQADDAGSRGWTTAIGGRSQYNACYVLSWSPSLGPVCQQAEFSPI